MQSWCLNERAGLIVKIDGRESERRGRLESRVPTGEEVSVFSFPIFPLDLWVALVHTVHTKILVAPCSVILLGLYIIEV